MAKESLSEVLLFFPRLWDIETRKCVTVFKMGEAVEDQQASGQTTHDETHVQRDPEVKFMNLQFR
jgi:hypothetical protein